MSKPFFLIEEEGPSRTEILIEETAIELHDKMVPAAFYLALNGVEKPAWRDENQATKDEYRAQAEVVINFLHRGDYLNSTKFGLSIDMADVSPFSEYMRYIRLHHLKVSMCSHCVANNFDAITYSKIERGIRLPSLKNLEWYAQCLGLSRENTEWHVLFELYKNEAEKRSQR